MCFDYAKPHSVMARRKRYYTGTGTYEQKKNTISAPVFKYLNQYLIRYFTKLQNIY
jgi:hypothetical protein